MLSCTSLTMASAALVGFRLAPDPSQATLPLGLIYLSVMLTMIPASLLMKKYGRRVGFAIGGCAAVVSGGVSFYGILVSSFPIFCTGTAIFGISSGFAHYYRFAAAEVSSESYKSRAISWVLAGGLIAAFIGPNLANLTKDVIPDAMFAASFASISLFGLGVIIIQLFIRIPLPSSEESSGEKRPLSFILTRPVFLVAVLCAMIAYATMNLLMTATPLAMHHHGMEFGDTAMVIQWHLVGMFAPSFFTGHLIHRFGVLKIMFTGAFILICCAIVPLAGENFNHFLLGLILLGIGWNFLYIGGTTLLTEVYKPAEKGVVQGCNEFLVFSATALTAMTSGYLHHTLGWSILNQMTIPLICFAALIIAFLGWQSKTSRLRTV
ncbi:MAG: MFS family permease [Gammaproteobacteria bacterium]|jgi:MFS family permease